MKPYKVCADGFGNYDVVGRKSGRKFGIVWRFYGPEWHAQACQMTFRTRFQAANWIWLNRIPILDEDRQYDKTWKTTAHEEAQAL